MKNKGSCGHGNISNNIIKGPFQEIDKPLHLIINQMFNTCIFQDYLEIEKNCLDSLKNYMTALSNYRPISLLTSFS